MRKTTTIFFVIIFLALCGQSIGKNDELQKQYLDKLRDINFKLTLAHNHLSYETSTNEMRKINQQIDVLNKDKSDLKLDALKYYKGKLPQQLLSKWEDEEIEYNKGTEKADRRIRERNRELEKQIRELKK